jgi:predicted AlkP superfamily phosphohydrolase/phosphomutase
VLALSLAGCGGDVPRTEVRHADLDAFARDVPASGAAQRVVLIGIDGASWDYLLPHVEAGELPSLARVVREGTTGRLRSIECHFTPPAWTSMLTGVLPERHGIYSFGTWHEAEQRFTKVTSNEVQAASVWDVASRAGRRVAVVGVPVTYPPHPVHGELVSGIMMPKTRVAPLHLAQAPNRRRPPDPTLRSFSPVLTAAFEDAHNVLLPTFVDTSDDGVANYDEVRLRTLRKGLGTPKRRTLSELQFPVDRFSTWVRVRLSDGPPREGFLKIRFDPPSADGLTYLLTPTFLRLRHPFTYPPELARELAQRFGYYLPHEFLSGDILESVTEEARKHATFFFREKPWDLYLYVFGQSDNAHHLIGFGEEALPIYRQIDGFVGEVLDGVDPDTRVVIASDHGFGPFEHSVDLNQYLAQLGLLHWKGTGVIDHDRTLVFHNMWHLYFNRKLLSGERLAEHGIEVGEGESPEDALARYLVRTAAGLRAPDGGPFPVELVRVPPDAVGLAPDMAVQATPDFWVEFWNVDRPSPQVVSPLAGNERWKHARDGIVAVWGPGVRQGYDLGTVDIQRVAPTLLDLLGLPVADDLDGEPLPVLTARAAEALPLHRVASYGEHLRTPVAVPEDPATFEETLRALGYVWD